MKDFDYLIVGAGLFGSVFAHEVTKAGKRCLIIDKRHKPGGNIRCENIEGINVHLYGPHIFHTSNDEVWQYVNQFCRFNHFQYNPVANYKGKLYSLPFNMNTFYQLWNLQDPALVQQKIKSEVEAAGIVHPRNLEEQAISMVGREIYELLVKGYTEKQWGRECKDLPPFIIKRIALRYTFDNNYFNDKCQGIPIGGYNVLINNLTAGIEIRTDTPFTPELAKMAKYVLYTGAIDEYYNYRFGELEYRSLRFTHVMKYKENYQGAAVMNYTDAETPYTRLIEHKHFEFNKSEKTIITYEYPQKFTPGAERYYPVNDSRNMELLKKYQSLARAEENVIFGGRLAEYKYYDMDQVIAAALNLARKQRVK